MDRSYLTECLKNEDGVIYAAKVSDSNSNEDKELGVTFSYVWKQDSLIWKAEDLLRDHFYEKADSVYDRAIASHPEHFYLYEAKKHLAYRATKSEEEIKTLYQRYIGQYGEARVWEEDGQLFYKRPGLARRILLPISDQEFLTLYAYDYKYKFDVQDGIVKGMNLYNYDNENETWKLNENWYYERTVLKN